MSIVSRGSLSLRKKDVLEQKNSGTAYRRLVFAHKANAGETGINFTALVQPSEMASLGFTNPSSADILAANILFYKKNLTVISSARGVLMQDLSYTVPTSSRIDFQGFTSLQDEIFTLLLDTGVKDGLTIVDAAPIVATGELAVGQTDFNVGTPFEANKYNSQQVGAVLVFRDGVIQFRNPSNGTSGGNYQEVDNGSGLTSVIRFNDAPVTEASQVVVWGHLMAERPDASMTAAIESVAGQVDQMIPTLAALAGVAESTFQAQPNNQDLKQFGDKVNNILDMEIPIMSAWQDFPSTAAGTLITGTGSNPTFGTVQTNKAQWRRVGTNMEIRWDYRQSTAGTAGTGLMLLNLPSGYSIDTTKAKITVTGTSTTYDMDSGSIGTWHYNDNGGAGGFTGTGPVHVYSATQLRFTGEGSSSAITTRGFLGGTGNAFTFAATLSIGASISVPIDTWQATQTIREALGL